VAVVEATVSIKGLKAHGKVLVALPVALSMAVAVLVDVFLAVVTHHPSTTLTKSLMTNWSMGGVSLLWLWLWLWLWLY